MSVSDFNLFVITNLIILLLRNYRWNVPCYFTASNPGILRITPSSILSWQEQLLQATAASKEERKIGGGDASSP